VNGASCAAVQEGVHVVYVFDVKEQKSRLIELEAKTQPTCLAWSKHGQQVRSLACDLFLDISEPIPCL
jgi:hypothetical protein